MSNKQARLQKKVYESKQARDILDACICIIGEIKYTNKRTDEDELEGVTISVWLKRFWNALENNNLML